ncbi:MAG: hypothetical protein ABSC11_03565 [Smithella sp.]
MRKILFFVLAQLLLLAMASVVCLANINEDLFNAARRLGPRGHIPD